MEIQIELPNEEAVKNFSKWFRKEGFDQFTKSKFNGKPTNDSYVTCLATDEQLSDSRNSSYAGQFFELQ